jgi:hypothetical protein
MRDSLAVDWKGVKEELRFSELVHLLEARGSGYSRRTAPFGIIGNWDMKN